MKYYKALLIIIFLIGSISCEKMEFKRDISGVWKCDGVGGGFIGTWIKPKAFSHISIRKNNRYYIYNLDTLKTSGEYIIKESDQNQEYFEPYNIFFKNSTSEDFGFPLNIELDLTIINNDTIVFGESNYDDGLQFFFTRK